MKTFLLVPALLVTACTEAPQPGEDQVTSPTEGEHDDTPDVPDVPDGPAAREIVADIMIDPRTCASTVALFEAGARYADDNTRLVSTDMACKWTFDDGSVSNDCVGEHEFATAGIHDFQLEVTDLTTGAVDVVTQTRIFHPPLEATLDVSTDGLTISYKAHSNTGGEQHVVVSPFELVLNAEVMDLDRTVTVSEAGTYTIDYYVEDERGVSEICNAHVSKQVTVTCDGHDHDHMAMH